MTRFQMPIMVSGIFDTYYPTQDKCREILLEHSYQVAQKALAIAALHPNWGVDQDFIEEAAWLHDIGINACHAPGIGCHGTEPYIRHGVIGAERLRKAGMPKHALVAERHTGAGLSLEKIIENAWDIPHREMMPVSLEEIIICVADKFFSKSKPNKEKSYEEVIQSLSKFSEEDVLRFDAWYKMLLLSHTNEQNLCEK